MSQGELESALAELRDNWNALHNQVRGRGSSPRKDIAAGTVAKVSSQYEAFRKWYDGISILETAVPWSSATFGPQLERELGRYSAARELAQSGLPKKESVSAPTMVQWEARFEGGFPWLLVGGAAAVSLLAGLWLGRR